MQITAWEKVRRGKSTPASQRRWVSGSYPFDDIISLLHRVNINLYYLECSSIAIGKMEYSKSPVSMSWYLCMILFNIESAKITENQITLNYDKSLRGRLKGGRKW